MNPLTGEGDAVSPTDPKRIVADGYDRIAERYSAWTGTDLRGPRAKYLALLRERLAPGAAVLDLGCATGRPVAATLTETFTVTGIEISPRQIELARANVPSATFIQGDMTSIELPPESFDAVIAIYAITHIPREEHAGLFARIAGWLRPGGVFVATLGAGDDPGTVEDDWLGAPMFFSGFDAESGRRLVESAGLEIIRTEEIVEDEDGVPVAFLWVVAENPPARAKAARPQFEGKGSGQA